MERWTLMWTRWSVIALTSLGGCFDAPSRAVQFRCEPERAPSCPDDYVCAPDGCCHRQDLDPEASWNGCYITDPSGTTSGPFTTSTTAPGTETMTSTSLSDPASTGDETDDLTGGATGETVDMQATSEAAESSSSTDGAS